jgi:hypothetical protein
LRLLHEDFCEFGASGRVYDRCAIIEALLASDGSNANAFAFKALPLSPDVVLLTYQRPGRGAGHPHPCCAPARAAASR